MRSASTGGSSARAALIVLLGLWMLAPWIRKPLNAGAGAGAGGGGLPLGVASLVALVVAGYSVTQDPYDIGGELPTEKRLRRPILAAMFPTANGTSTGARLTASAIRH